MAELCYRDDKLTVKVRGPEPYGENRDYGFDMEGMAEMVSELLTRVDICRYAAFLAELVTRAPSLESLDARVAKADADFRHAAAVFVEEWDELDARMDACVEEVQAKEAAQ